MKAEENKGDGRAKGKNGSRFFFGKKIIKIIISSVSEHLSKLQNDFMSYFLPYAHEGEAF